MVRLPRLSPQRQAEAKSWVQALSRATVRQARAEWLGSPFHLFLIGRPRPEGLAVSPRDFRPLRAGVGGAMLQGDFDMCGRVLELGPGGDPWNRPSPSRAFAVELHRFEWLRDLVGMGEPGAKAALRLLLDWEVVFGRWNAFAWSGEVIERRVFNLACALKAVTAGASDVERTLLVNGLGRQTRHLMSLTAGLGRAAERSAAAAVGACALGGRAGEKLLARALGRLTHCLPHTVLPDGGHVSRSPEAALELLLDLLALDDGLLQLGREPPEEVVRAIDRLTAALRFFTLADGCLACFQGGEAGDPARIDAARAHDDGQSAPASQAPHSGYERLNGRLLQVIVDAAPPADGDWGVTACAQPLALEVLSGKDRLITNSGWSPKAEASQALRLTPAGSTIALSSSSAGEPLVGFRAKMLGARLMGGASVVDVRRHQAEDGIWLELSHDAWADPFGLTHERRLYLDHATDELRGEDRLVPLAEGSPRSLPFTVHFHLHPDVRASLARDQRSVLLQGPTSGGWWLRNDAAQVSIAPAVHFDDGQPRRTSQVVLRGSVRGDRGGRMRWKLAAADTERP